MFQGLKLCISTGRVDTIDETVKVLVDRKSCWVKIKEATSVTHGEYLHREDDSEKSNVMNHMDDVSWNSEYEEEECLAHEDFMQPPHELHEDDEQINTGNQEAGIEEQEASHISVNVRENHALVEHQIVLNKGKALGTRNTEYSTSFESQNSMHDPNLIAISKTIPDREDASLNSSKKVIQQKMEKIVIGKKVGRPRKI